MTNAVVDVAAAADNDDGTDWKQMWGIVMMDANRCDDGDCGEEEDWG